MILVDSTRQLSSTSDSRFPDREDFTKFQLSTKGRRSLGVYIAPSFREIWCEPLWLKLKRTIYKEMIETTLSRSGLPWFTKCVSSLSFAGVTTFKRFSCPLRTGPGLL